MATKKKFSASGRKPSDPYPTEHYGDIVFVEYIGGKPTNVVTTEHGYDFDEVGGGMMFYDHGSGYHPRRPELSLSNWVDPTDTSWWAADCVVLTFWDKTTKETRPATQADLLAYASTRLTDLPSDPFENADESEAGICYCTLCEEHFDRDSTCNHLFWGEDGLTGPGDSECGQNNEPGEDCKDSFLALCRRAGIVRALAKGLNPFTWEHSELHATGGLGPSYVWFKSAGKNLGNIARKLGHGDGKVSLRAGAGWLMALDEKTTGANAMTLAWLEDEIASQNARRASGKPVYLVTDAYGQRVVNNDGDVTREPDNGLRLSWEEARARAKRCRKAGSREIAIVYVRPSAAPKD